MSQRFVIPNIATIDELLDMVVVNAVQEHQIGFANTIKISVSADNWCSVEDNGRGIPVDVHRPTGLNIVELTFGREDGRYHWNQAIRAPIEQPQAVGSCFAVSKHCQTMTVAVDRNQYQWITHFAYGKVTQPTHREGPTVCTGTRVSFLADPEFFAGQSYNHATLTQRLTQLAMANPALTIELVFDDCPMQIFSYSTLQSN